MDALSGLALLVVIAAVVLYAVYWVVRKAVAAGRLDTLRRQERTVIESRDRR